MRLKILLLQSFAISLFVFLKSLTYIPATVVNQFLERDIIRAAGLIKGKMIWFGPELSYFGFSPGPFFYYLIALPAAFGSLDAVLQLMYLLFAVSCGIIWYYLSKTIDRTIAAVVLTLYISSNLILKVLATPMNPSFVFLFWVLLAILLHQSILNPEKKVSYWYWFCLLTGLTAQIHISSIYWYPIGLILLLRGKLPLKQVLKGSLFLLIAQAPFWIWLLFNDFLNSSALFFSRLDELLKPAPIGTFFSIDSTPLSTLMHNFIYCVGGPLLFTLVLLIIKFIITPSPRQPLVKKYIFILALILASFFYVKDYLNPLIVHRYIQPVYFLFLAFTIYLYTEVKKYFQPAQLKFFTFFIVSVLALYLVGLNTLYSNQKFFGIPVFLKQAQLNTGQIKKISALIYEKTNWDENEFSKRIFLIGLFDESAFKLIYSDTIKQLPVSTNFNKNIAGFILTGKSVNLTAPTESPPSSPIGHFVQNKSIEIIEQLPFDNINIISYKISDKNIPVNLTSIADHYREDWQILYNNDRRYIKYSVPAFTDQDAILNIYYDPAQSSLTFHSSALARKYVVAPQLNIVDPVLDYSCNSELKTLSLYSLGYSGEFTMGVLLSPSEYKMDPCKNFKPVKLSAKRVTYKKWIAGGQPETISDFIFTF